MMEQMLEQVRLGSQSRAFGAHAGSDSWPAASDETHPFWMIDEGDGLDDDDDFDDEDDDDLDDDDDEFLDDDEEDDDLFDDDEDDDLDDDDEE